MINNFSWNFDNSVDVNEKMWEVKSSKTFLVGCMVYKTRLQLKIKYIL